MRNEVYYKNHNPFLRKYLCNAYQFFRKKLLENVKKMESLTLKCANTIIINSTEQHLFLPHMERYSSHALWYLLYIYRSISDTQQEQKQQQLIFYTDKDNIVVNYTVSYIYIIHVRCRSRSGTVVVGICKHSIVANYIIVLYIIH